MWTLLLSLIARCFGVQAYYRIPAQFFGHLAVEPDLYLKEVEVGIREPIAGLVWLIDDHPSVNWELAACWKKTRKITLLYSGLRYKLVSFLANKVVIKSLNLVLTPQSDTESYRFVATEAKWLDRSPILKISDAIEEEGKRYLSEFGFSDGDWFVFLHCRESGFDGSHQFHHHRNVVIESYRKAVELIQERGGWVIRLGDSSMAPFTSGKRFIDFATSGHISARLDLYFLARAKFGLGSASGPSNVAAVFGTPVLWTNMAPFSTGKGIRFSDLAIPKLIRSKESGAVLDFPVIMDSVVANFRRAEKYEDFKEPIELVDNTPEEIHLATVDMFKFLEDQSFDDPDDRKRQQQFESLFKPCHLCFGAPGKTAPSFLRLHEDKLFSDERCTV